MELKDLINQRRDEVFVPNDGGRTQEVIPLDQMEKEAIINALEQTRGNKRNAAKMLSISERTLYRKIKEYGL